MSIACCLWYPHAAGPVTAVQLAELGRSEWIELAEWAQAHRDEFPALHALLSLPLPARVAPADLPPIAGDCQRVNWEQLPHSVGAAFSAFSLFVGQAAAQRGAGLRFDADA